MLCEIKMVARDIFQFSVEGVIALTINCKVRIANCDQIKIKN